METWCGATGCSRTNCHGVHCFTHGAGQQIPATQHRHGVISSEAGLVAGQHAFVHARVNHHEGYVGYAASPTELIDTAALSGVAFQDAVKLN